MHGMTVYDMVQIERKMELKGASARHDPKVEPERPRLFRRRPQR